MTCTDATSLANPGTHYLNRDPGMKTFELAILTCCYCVLCVAIIALNYLAFRAFLTTFYLMRPYRSLLCNLAFADLMAGWLSIPSFLHNMNHGPNAGFFVYEASDVIIGTVSSITLILLLLQVLWLRLDLPRFEAVWEGPVSHVTIATTWFLAVGVAAFNVVSTTGIMGYQYFFYFTIGWLSVSAFAIFVTSAVVMVTKKRQRNEAYQVQEMKLAMTILITAVVFLCLWVLPYIFFAYSYLCQCCTDVPALFFLVVRMLLYLKSFITPVLYIHRIPPFWKAVKRILSKDCCADVSEESEC